MTDSCDAVEIMRLRGLQFAYADALDRCDTQALLAVFEPDATLRVFWPGEDDPRAVSQGHDQLTHMPGAMRTRYATTMHVITNNIIAVDGDTATGSAYCVAHHIVRDEQLEYKFVAHLKYVDLFRRQSDGSWRISQRDIRMLWGEQVPVLPWDKAAIIGRLG